MYLLMGFLTTVVNIVSFKLLCTALKANEENKDNNFAWKIAEIISFVIAVAFAFITNKLFVFKSMDFSLALLWRELGEFILARIITEVINFVIMWYMIDKKKCNELFTKIIASIVVIVLNYVFSKFIIFRK